MKISYYYRPGASCDYHRIELPMKYIQPISADLNQADFSLFCRAPSMPIMDKYIIDIDDYWYLYPHHYIFNSWNAHNTPVIWIKYMKGAELITTTTSLLAEKIARINKNVEIIPNALPFGEDQFRISKSQSDICRFFYAGGPSHLHDLAIIGPIIRQLGIDFTIQGYNPSVADWNRIKDAFGHKTKFIINQPIESYLNTYNADVMLIPLENNVFNQHKSNLKILEAAATGMAVIASRIQPYYNEVDEPYVLYASTPDEWKSHINYCSHNPNFVKDQAAALGEHCKEQYDLNKINKYREQVYYSIL